MSTPTPTTQPFSLFGSVLPSKEPSHADKNLTETCIPSSEGSQSTKKGAKKKKSPKAVKQADDESSSTSSRRRSVRFRDEEQKSQSLKETVVIDSSDRVKDHGEVADSVVIIDDDSERIEISDVEMVDDADIAETAAPKEETNVVKDVDSKKLSDSLPEIDLVSANSESEKSSQILEAQQLDSVASGKIPNADSSGSSKETPFESVPANVLGVLDFTPLSPSKSSESKSPMKSSQENPSSEPLFSWSQKLSQLSQSPKNVSPLKKVSQESQKSPKQRAASPMKSPRRNKKKLINENDGDQGNLDKWIIRSPGKGLPTDDIVLANSEVNVFSTTFVEDTVSPTKFKLVGKEKDIESKLHSIMETPPKHVLENSSSIYSNNSNRKLFQSCDNVHSMAIEDSNIVPVSPNCKSFSVASGSPVLKLTRLTDGEIRRYSPSKEHGADENKNGNKTSKLSIDLCDENKVIVNDETSHEHDDFSVFKPLDTEDEPINTDFFSKGLTDSEQDMLKLSEDEKFAESDDEKRVMSEQSERATDVDTSPSLFSQDSAFRTSPVNSNVSQAYDPCLTNTLKSSSKINKKNSETDSQGSESELNVFSNESSGSFDILVKDTLVSNSETPKGKGKRKQTQPKRRSPEDIKFEKKKRKSSAEKTESLVSDSGSAKKSSNRIKERKARESLEKEDQLNKLKVKKEKHGKKEISEDTLSNEKQKMKKNISLDKDITDNTSNKESATEVEIEVNNGNIKQNKQIGKNDKIDKNDKSLEDITKSKTSNNSAGSHNDESVVSNGNNGGDHGDRDKKYNVSNSQENMKLETELTKIKHKSNVEMSEEVPMDTDSEPIKLSQDRLENSNKELENEIVIVGQKTPESRNSTEQPERKSTTKQKKAIAQKRVQKRENDIVINDSDSNLDNDNEPLTTLVKKLSAENLEKKMIKQSETTKTDNVIEEKSDSNKSDEKDSLTEKVTKPARGRKKKLKNKAKIADHASKKVQPKDCNSSADFDSSFMSDDDVPLSDIKIKVQKQYGNNYGDNEGTNKGASSVDGIKTGNVESNKRQSSKKAKIMKQSPVSTKLRSSQITNLNLRSGEKKIKVIKTSPQAKKSVNLALKRTRKREARKKLEIFEDGTEKSGLDCIDGDICDSDIMEIDEADVIHFEKIEKINISEIEKDAESTFVNMVNVTENKINTCLDAATGKDNRSSSNMLDSIKEAHREQDEKEVHEVSESTMERLNKLLSIEKEMDETPRKPKDIAKPSALPFSVIHSDSKLILGSRKFDKRRGFARRSILKPCSVSSSTNVASPKREFHPIIVGEIYSPTASPSASILKKRRLSIDPEVDTSSPPNKQRRVSFAEPITEVETTKVEPQRPASPLVTKLENKLLATAEEVSTQTGTQESSCPTQSSRVSRGDTQSTVGTPSQNSLPVSQDTPLNMVDPVFPDLLDCKTSVEKVLPQLTSTVWSRGLGQLVRARNIHTIGDLCALTETDIDSLPIKSPKVATVRKALGRFGENRQMKLSKLWGGQKGAEETGVNGGESAQDSTAQKTDMDVDESGKMKDDGTVVENATGKPDVTPSDIDAILASSGDLLDEVNKLTQTVDQSEDRKKSHDTGESQSDAMDLNSNSTEEVGIPPVRKSDNVFLDSLSELVLNCQSTEIQGLRTDQLFQAHQYITDLQNKVVTSLRTRCHSPTS